MNKNTLNEHLAEAVLATLEETFTHVQGIYLDEGTSLFETLATITAEEASRPVSANCASIAAHVEHVRLSIETVMQFMRGERPRVDWTEIWRTVRDVSPEEWAINQKALRETYQRLRAFVTNIDTWEGDDVRGVLGLLMHNAYHLGEIRQAMCTIKTES